MSDLVVPDSVKSYFTDGKVQTAVNDLMGQLDGRKMPVTSWSDQREYHQALLMAAKVRADFADFMFETLSLIWKGTNELEYEDSDKWTPSEILQGRELTRSYYFSEQGEDLDLPFVGFSIEIRDELTFPSVAQWASVGSDFTEIKELQVIPGWKVSRPVKEYDHPCHCPDPVSTEKFVANAQHYVDQWSDGAKAIVKAFKDKQTHFTE